MVFGNLATVLGSEGGDVVITTPDLWLPTGLMVQKVKAQQGRLPDPDVDQDGDDQEDVIGEGGDVGGVIRWSKVGVAGRLAGYLDGSVGWVTGLLATVWIIFAIVIVIMLLLGLYGILGRGKNS